MYSLTVPYKNYKQQPRTQKVTFHLDAPDIMKLSPEFNTVFNWRDEQRKNPRDLTPDEVIPYFDAFENILLSCWGEMSEDGEHFRRGGRYDFEESACFKAAMMMFITDPSLIVAFLDGVVPKDLEEVLKQQQANLGKMDEQAAAAGASDEERERLQARIRELEQGSSTGTQDSPEA